MRWDTKHYMRRSFFSLQAKSIKLDQDIIKSRRKKGIKKPLRNKTNKRKAFMEDGNKRTLNNSPDVKHKQVNQKKNLQNQIYEEKTVVIIYHKPANIVTTHASENFSDSQQKNREKRKNVYEDILSMKGYTPIKSSTSNKPISSRNDTAIPSFSEVTGIRSKLHAIGRLDAATTGALLLTNDGMLIHHATNPNANFIDITHDQESTTPKQLKKKNKIIKTYEALIMGYHEMDQNITNKSESTASILSQILMGGIMIPGSSSPTLPVPFLHVLSHPTPKTTLIRLGLIEGKNRHIRKLFHTLKSGVIRLHRARIGNVDLEEEGLCEQGMWRVLSEEEVYAKLGWRTRILDNNKDLVNKNKKLNVENRKGRRKFTQRR